MADGSVVIDTELNDKGVKNGLNKLGNIASNALKGTIVAIGSVTTAFAGMVVASVNARGELEQNIGGVETLFKGSAQKVIENAEKAYKTAGMSANEYMSNVTSFAASLLQSVSGDTEKAAQIADMAMVDMSDNANKMGTDMQSIQNAYQGFAKQNYTMLDNLKLGYGGTKTEMERLLADAEKISNVKYDINNLSDVYNAIHTIQQELDITGTTAKESTETLQGSMASMKASWDNFLSGTGNIGNVVETATNVFENLIRIVNEAIPFMINSIMQDLPQLLNLGIGMINTIATGIIQYLPELTKTGIQIIVQLSLGIINQIPELIPIAVDCIFILVDTLLDNLDTIIDAGIELLLALIDGIIEALPKLIEKAPEIIEKLYNAFEKNFPKIVKAGGELLGKLVAGIIGSMYKLLEVAPKLISNIVKGLKSGWNQISNVGKYLIEGLWNGISGMANWVTDKVKSFASNILNNMKQALGIHSPSKVFRDEVGKNIALGVGEGFTRNIGAIYKQMKSTVDFETQRLSSSITANQQINIERNSNVQATLDSIDNNREIVVNSTLEVDGRKMANTVNKVNAREKLRYGIA